MKSFSRNLRSCATTRHDRSFSRNIAQHPRKPEFDQIDARRAAMGPSGGGRYAGNAEPQLVALHKFFEKGVS